MRIYKVYLCLIFYLYKINKLRTLQKACSRKFLKFNKFSPIINDESITRLHLYSNSK